MGAPNNVIDKLRAYFDSIHVEHFIPMTYQIKTVKRRRQVVQVPLITNLIFIKTTLSNMYDIKIGFPGLKCRIDHCADNKYDKLVIPTKQMEDFIKVCQYEGENVRYVEFDQLDVKPGTRVRFRGGELEGVEAVLKKVKGFRSKKYIVSINGFKSVVTSGQGADFIEILKNK